MAQYLQLGISHHIIIQRDAIVEQSYNHYLHYMQKLVRSNSAYSIAGALRACIQ